MYSVVFGRNMIAWATILKLRFYICTQNYTDTSFEVWAE